MRSDLILRAVGDQCGVFFGRVELISEVSSRCTVLGFSIGLLGLFKTHRRDSVFRCNPEERMQGSDPASHFQSAGCQTCFVKMDLGGQVGFGALGPGFRAEISLDQTLGHTLVFCGTYQGFQRN